MNYSIQWAEQLMFWTRDRYAAAEHMRWLLIG